ncbi:hypothetical protein [Staphylococcus saprophyticus]|uniref:hypothetical protein n=1 Tax=Staphylococcus saprophyticus TaxID=29385 RepID=UPI0022EA5045|nr:hypothetical protein [Staphylococcus saprophyticus]
MVKIKQKKQLNLPQLIEWLLKSGYRNYTANSNMGNIVTLSRYGAIQFSLGTFFPEETFTVEVEEEITEETEFRELVGLRADDSYWKYDNTCIYDFNLEIIKAIYIPNNDLTMTLIWRDGKLVE